MNRKATLSLIVGLLVIIGAVFVLIPLTESLTINAKQENDAWGSCDVSDLQKGKVKRCGWASVYRRNDKDIEMVGKFVSLLADPASLHSHQPVPAQNHWRSENKEYFVFKPWAPVRRCEVELINSPNYYGWEPPEAPALNELPYFIEPCEGRTWDTSGRLYKRVGYPPEKNLSVPQVKWVSPTKVLIYGGQA